MNNKNNILLSLLTASILAGCGAESSINVKEEPLPASVGVFVDDPVEGLGYRAYSAAGDLTRDGLTNANGEFEYFRGEALTFFIGDLELPSTTASSIITPLAIHGTDSVFNTSVINTLRLLQTLDTDGDPTNGITISSNAAVVATVPEELDAEGNPIPYSAEDFFAQSETDFAADVETWLVEAGALQATLVTTDQAIENFVDYIYSQYNSTQGNAFDVTEFSGSVYNSFIEGGAATYDEMVMTPDDEEINTSGTYNTFSGDVEVDAGSYEFLFGNRILALTTPATDTAEATTQYMVARSYNTVDSVYSLCLGNSAATLASMVKDCDEDESSKDNLFTFSEEQNEIQLVNLENLALIEGYALNEDFNTDTETFFSSGYKRLTNDAGSGALYARTGGTKPVVDAATGQLTLDADRFSIGNTASADTTSSDTAGTGIYNLSEGFTISFLVVEHNGTGSLSLYVDNNTASQSNSVHGAASKFYGKSIDETNTPAGQRFSYTYTPGEDVNTGTDLTHVDARGILNADIKNSFFQIRNDTGSVITIDDLIIETVAEEVVIEPVEPEEPVGDALATETFETTADEFFTAAYKSLPTNGSAPLYNVTSGSERLTITNGVMSIDNARFSWGNTTPGTETTADDTTTTGVYDLSVDYSIAFDVISASEPDSTDQGNSFMIYVDNNTSKGGLSIHGSASKFYSIAITDLAQLAGTTVTVPGYIATSTSFLQLRAESGAVVEIDNLRIISSATPEETELTLDYTNATWGASLNGSPLVVNVTALTDYNATPDTFTATSSDDAVVSVSIDGDAVTLTPLTTGSATITFVSNTDSSVSQTITVTVTEPDANLVIDKGYAGYNFDITGGAGGTAVTVNNGTDLIAALSDAKSANTPVTIYVDGTITDVNSGGTGDQINIKDMDNVSIIGVADRGEFDGIGIAIRRANNIIIQNLKIHEVLTEGKDGISIEGDDDGSTTANIWIDHNEIYADLAVTKDYYDGLLDSKSGAQNITISYNYLHDGQKTSLHGHTDGEYPVGEPAISDNTNRLITFHHNRFENLVSRVPLFRFGQGHIYNNYYNEISSTAINSRMGAELLIESNYFENTQNPIVSFYSATIGYWNLSGNFFADTVTWTTPEGTDASAKEGANTTDYVAPYTYTLTPVADVKDHVIANAGIGKLDQSGLTIPAVTDTTPTEDPVQDAIGIPFTENFSAANADEFFSNSYRDLTGAAGTGTPLFHRVTGTVSVASGELTMTGARISIGNTTPSTSTTDADTTNTGVFDLSQNYQVSFKVVAVAGVTTKGFQIYVDNNTSSSGSSILGKPSKFYSIALDDLVIGQTYTVDGLVASSTSFITLRTEGDATITIDDLEIK